MALTVRGAIMAVGGISVDLNHTPEVYEDLWDEANNRPHNLYLLVVDADDNLAYPPFVLRRVDGGEEGLSIGGPGILWEFGAGGVGPPIEDREYLSGANKLSNPLNPAAPLVPPDLMWSVGDSGWVIGAGFATVAGSVDNLEDQLLLSEESWPVVEGASYTASVDIGRIVGTESYGRLRLRMNFRGGPFVHPDQLPAFSTWDPSTGTDIGEHDITYDGGSDSFIAGPSAMPNLVVDGEMDNGPLTADWIEVSTWGQGTDGGWNGANYAFNDNSGFEVLVSTHPISVVQGQKYEARFVGRANPGSPATDGQAWMQMALATIAGPPYTRIDTPALKGPMPTTDWNIVRYQFEIPEAHISMTAILLATDGTTGRWDYDTVTLIRTEGNVDFATSPIFAITPGRSYRWTQPVVTDVGVRSGTVSLAMVCFVATRPAIILQGPSVKVTGGATEVIEWEFTPPSGMDVCMARIVCQDVVGGSVRFPQAGASIRQTDTSTVVPETVGPLASAGETMTLTVAAPVGAKDVHVELVAEAYGIGWVASGFSLIRDTDDPATGDDIVADLLVNLLTGLPLSIGAGDINCPEGIPYDWRQINLTNRAALDHYCTVVSLPVREYRLTASNPPLLDVATAALLWPDPGPASAFLPDDIDVEEIAPPATDIADRATEIVVLGNERELVSGGTLLITATAQVPGPTEEGLNLNPIARRKYVSDGTVDHLGYAQARADDLAEQEANPAWAVKVTLSGTDEYEVDRAKAIESGQTVYLYKPDAGIIDTANETTINGVEVFPRRGRVLELQRDHGPSYRVVMLAPDGEMWDLPGVILSEDDRTQVTVGDRLPLEWTADPQGGLASKQYTDDRQSRPRGR